MTKECVAIIAIMNLSYEERAPDEVISTGLGLGRVIDRATRRGVHGVRLAWRWRTDLTVYLCCTVYLPTDVYINNFYTEQSHGLGFITEFILR